MMLLQKKGHNLPFRSNRILYLLSDPSPDSFSVFLQIPNHLYHQNDAAAAYSDFALVTRELDIKDDYPVVDEESETFRSSGGAGDGNDVIVAGYTAILPPTLFQFPGKSRFCSLTTFTSGNATEDWGSERRCSLFVASYAAKKGSVYMYIYIFFLYR